MKKIKKFFVAVSATLVAGLSVGALTACGEDEAIKIAFNTDGGAKISSITVKEGKTYELPAPAEREGYAFEGWYDNAEFSGSPVSQVVAGKKSKTYYAKWTQLAKITLQLDGGTLEKQELYVKAGTNVAEFMKDYVPTKEGLIFGAWFDGATELSANKKMPADGLTLTAKYKVEYTVKLMLETIAGGQYKETLVKKSDYVGKGITVAEEPEGFSEIAHAETVKTGTLSSKSSENVFTQYFNRNTYTLTFRPNYPADSQGTDKNATITKKFGEEFVLPTEYSCNGYVLAGWALSATGDVDYKTNQIERAVFNAQDGERPEATKTTMIGKDASLYAVWKKGYTDMFGGADTIFFLEEEGNATNEKIYLSRGGKFFEGVYYVRNEIFEFQTGSTKLSGKLFDQDVFAYSSSDRDDTWSFLFDNGELKEDVRIDFDKYNGIKYTEKDSKGFTSESEGTYTIEDGLYIAKFTSGSLKDKTLTFLVGTVTSNGTKQNAFQMRKDDEIEMGEIVGYKVNGKTVAQDSEAYVITLNGFGVATCAQGGSQGTYYYKIKDGIITIESRYGAEVLVGRLSEADGKNVYFTYNESVDGTFAFANGDTIALNGSHEAVYKADGKEETGLFTFVGESVFGGSIVDVYVGDNTYRMTVKTTEEKVLEDGEIVSKYHYEAEEKLLNYSEYYYLNDGLIYYAPLLVLDAEKENEAKVYGLNGETDEYILASKGEYKKVEGANQFVYTASQWFNCEGANTEPFDLSKLKVVVFNVDTQSTDYNLSYWYSSANGNKDTTEEAVDYSDTYTSSKNDGATLVLISGFAFYQTANEMTYQGAFVVKDGIMTVYAGMKSYYFAIDEDNKKFTALEYAPYNAHAVKQDGVIDQAVYLAFDGTGKATYTVLTLDDEGEELSRTEEVGTVSNTKLTTDYNSEIWKFESEKTTFTYITVSQSSAKYIIPFNEKYSGELQSAAGRLTLDGYIYGAKFVDADKQEYEGSYFIEEENVVQLLYQKDGEKKTLYFDINGKSFTVRGKEYGEYLITKNQYGTQYVELNGYGKLSVYTKEEVEGEDEPKKTYIAQDGEYVMDGEQFTLTYQVGGKDTVLTGTLGTAFTDDGKIPAFLVYNEQKAYTYVNESDWSTIILDDFGRAVRYDKEGQKEQGKFTVVDKDLLYYTSENQSNSMIYSYDVEKGIIKRVEKLTQVAYYTENLESLLFTEYGFAVFNGTYTYYYRVDESNNVIIYRQDPSAQNANEYGFVAENFGAFAQTKEWTVEGEEKSYIKNAGWSIEFSRSDGKTTGEGDNQTTTYPYPVATKTETKYPLKNLKFQPTDEAEFSVKGTVEYAGKTTVCIVSREIVDEKTGEAKMYVSLEGYDYRFYIEVVYNGSANTYKVVAMTEEKELPSYNYLYSYYVYALFYGQIIENDIGTIYIHGNYDEAGDAQDFSITAEFLEGSEFKGVDDKILAFEKGTYAKNGALYSTQFTATDGEKYGLHFQTATVMGSTGYRVAALTRYQSVQIGEYTVEVSNIIATEATNFSVGDLYLYDLTLYKNGEELEAANVFELNNTYYYVVEGETANTYYKIRLTEEGSSLESDQIPQYVDGEIAVETATTKVDANNEKLSVDISNETGKVLMIRLLNGNFYAKESTYDETTKIHEVKTTDNKTIYVKILDDGKVRISDLKESL